MLGRARDPIVVLAVAAAVTACFATPVRAQPSEREAADVTRLDVERLPPEVAPVSRSLFARGAFVEASTGAMGFVSGLRDYGHPGPWMSVAFGWEILRVLSVRLAIEGSVHGLAAPPPPSSGFFELFGGTLQVRLSLAVTARFAAWLGGEGGLVVVFPGLLESYGVRGSTSLTPQLGGQLGLDWHFLERHLSAGLHGGARLMPGLKSLQGDTTLAVLGAAYLRYVF